MKLKHTSLALLGVMVMAGCTDRFYRDGREEEVLITKDPTSPCRFVVTLKRGQEPRRFAAAIEGCDPSKPFGTVEK